MGKGPLFLNVMRGKVGNVVGYALKNSNNKEKQAFRAYVAQVSNPKTEPQAIQRLKLAPAVTFYRQLSRILDNAWQGQKYGNDSRQHFMSLAMKQSTGIPFLVKGDKKFYPGQYPVSEGSLARISVTGIASDKLATSLVSPGVTGTWGAFSQGLINKNFGIKDGDKLTFIFVGVNALGDYLPAYSYIILDTTNTSTAESVLSASNLTFEGAADANLSVGVINAVSGIVAGAVIASRLDETGTGKWLRSSSVMYCAESYLEVMMSADAYQAAIASYTDSQNYESDWYLNQGIVGRTVYYSPGGNSGSNITIVSVENITFSSSGGTELEVAIATMSNGTHYACKTSGTASKMVVVQNGVLSATQNSATSERLALIQAVDSLVVGWISVDPTGTVIEEP